MSETSTHTKKTRGEQEWNETEVRLAILDELKRNKPIKASEIKAKLIEKNIVTDISRRAVVRHLLKLQEFGELTGLFTIKANEKEPSSKMQIKYSYTGNVKKDELRLVFEAFSRTKGVSGETRKKVLEIIRFFTTDAFVRTLDYENGYSNDKNQDPSSFLKSKNLKTIHNAILRKDAVRFRYGEYDIKGRLNPQKDKNGEVKLYEVYPLKTMVSLGRYYLICKPVNEDELRHFRIDRITNIVDINTNEVSSHDNSKLLPEYFSEYAAQHIYMLPGKTVLADIVFSKNMLSEVFDQFGTQLNIRNYDDNNFAVSVTVNENDLVRWALQYSDSVVVTSPARIAERITETLKRAEVNYHNVLSKDKS